ncbi:hypothetical protein R80B4_00835 [Fibrobacteres bacterium R8-0-B4]
MVAIFGAIIGWIVKIILKIVRPKKSKESVIINDNPTNAKEQFELGQKYNIGDGVKKDQKKAYSLFVQSAEQGYADAMIIVSNYHRYGVGGVVPKNEEKASYYEAKYIEQLTKEAEQGSAEAMGQLGMHYMWNKSYVLSKRWFTKSIEKYKEAANQGDVEALYNIYLNYASGLESVYYAEYGVFDPDIRKETMVWLTVAAEQGHPRAQYSLGLRYLDGSWGFPKNTEKAIYWINKAAEQGNADAIEEIKKNRKLRTK